LEFGCGGIVWIESDDGVQLLEGGVKFLQQAGRRVVGGEKLGDGGWSIGPSEAGFHELVDCSREVSDDVLWLEWCRWP